MVMKKLSNHKFTFEQLNSEINEIYEYLKSENYKEEDIKRIFLPLTSEINKKTSKTTYCILSLILLVTLIYLLTYFETIDWHISAVGRILLIKILPLFDWTYLKNKQCLIEKLKFSSNDDRLILNCNLCENINKIDAYENIDEEALIQRYIELDVPVIITKGLDLWPKNSSFVEDLILDDTFYYSYPCKLSTNIFKGLSNIGEILERVQIFDEYFLHFQNCELEAMKSFRIFTYRPEFLPSIYSPILCNWMVWNKNYNSSKYKQIDLVEKLTVFGQLFGSTYVQLIPRDDCQNVCPTLDIKLNKGESIVFTSLWDLQYRPGETGENMAAILETRN